MQTVQAPLALTLIVAVVELTAILVDVDTTRIGHGRGELRVVVDVVLIGKVAAVGRLLLVHQRVEDAPVLERVDAATVECVLEPVDRRGRIAPRIRSVVEFRCAVDSLTNLFC